MNTSTAVYRGSASRHLLSGAAVLLFLAGVVVAPLAAALTLCAMPCCNHQAPVAPEATNTLPCDSDCTISEVEAPTAIMASTPSLRADAAAPAAVIATLASSSPAVASSHETGTHLAAPHRALHLVHSVFLI